MKTTEELNDLGIRFSRLQHTVAKLAGWQGIDISELIEDGYLKEGDLD